MNVVIGKYHADFNVGFREQLVCKFDIYRTNWAVKIRLLFIKRSFLITFFSKNQDYTDFQQIITQNFNKIGPYGFWFAF
jgi:hypothetical protein